MYKKLSLVGVVLLGTVAVAALPYPSEVTRITSHEAVSLVGNACPGCYVVDMPWCSSASDEACSGQSEETACTFCDGGLANTAECRRTSVGPYDACTVEDDPEDPAGCGDEYTGFCSGGIPASCDDLEPTGGSCPGPLITLTPCVP